MSSHLDTARQWAKSYTFSDIQTQYATILALKILDGKCQMSGEDQTIFMAVYDGIGEKIPSPWTTPLHRLISQSRVEGQLACHPSSQDTIKFHRQEAEGAMQRPIMKSYKAMVRQALGITSHSD